MTNCATPTGMLDAGKRNVKWRMARYIYRILLA